MLIVLLDAPTLYGSKSSLINYLKGEPEVDKEWVF